MSAWRRRTAVIKLCWLHSWYFDELLLTFWRLGGLRKRGGPLWFNLVCVFLYFLRCCHVQYYELVVSLVIKWNSVPPRLYSTWSRSSCTIPIEREFSRSRFLCTSADVHVDAYTSCTLLGTKLGRGLSIFIAGPILIPMRVCMFWNRIPRIQFQNLVDSLILVNSNSIIILSTNMFRLQNYFGKQTCCTTNLYLLK